jgi:hypothetical protein
VALWAVGVSCVSFSPREGRDVGEAVDGCVDLWAVGGASSGAAVVLAIVAWNRDCFPCRAE